MHLVYLFLNNLTEAEYSLLEKSDALQFDCLNFWILLFSNVDIEAFEHSNVLSSKFLIFYAAMATCT